MSFKSATEIQFELKPILDSCLRYQRLFVMTSFAGVLALMASIILMWIFPNFGSTFLALALVPVATSIYFLRKQSRFRARASWVWMQNFGPFAVLDQDGARVNIREVRPDGKRCLVQTLDEKQGWVDTATLTRKNGGRLI